MDLGEFQLRGRLRPTSANWVFACMRVYHEVPDWLSLGSGIPGFDPVYQSHTKVCLETSEESRRSTLHRLLLKSSSYVAGSNQLPCLPNEDPKGLEEARISLPGTLRFAALTITICSVRPLSFLNVTTSGHFCLDSVIISSFVKSSNHSFKEPPTNNQPRTELRRAVSPTDPSVLFSTE
ncbi:hypothetical protein PABG_04261 [Paracoccidioides brasiliensis Pb03]|nr:hypothetical protein PABG_04261 [Paracoccidioides brasiliensis Pb03]